MSTIFKLHVEQGGEAGREFVLHEGSMLIGRSSKAQIRLRGEDVSGEHARIVIEGTSVVLFNLSQFGTSVDNTKLERNDHVQLKQGQSIRLGQTWLRFRIASASDRSTTSGQTHIRSLGTTSAYTGAASQAEFSSPGTSGGRTSPDPTTPGQVSTQFTSATAAPAIPGVSPEFDREMRAEAEAAQLDDPTERPSDGGTQEQKTRVGSNEEIQKRLELERKRRKQQALGVMGAIIAAGLLLVILIPKHSPESRLAWRDSDPSDTSPSPLGGYMLVYPTNETTSVDNKTPGVLTITTRLGSKHDVPLFLTLREDLSDRWALQDISESLQQWKTNDVNCICGPLSSRFAGKLSGVRIWTASFMRKEGDVMRSGRVDVFFHGRRRTIFSVEVPDRVKTRAEDYLLYDYFDFPPDFEDSHWEGQPPSKALSVQHSLAQISVDLRREAPDTWAGSAKLLRMILCQSVAEHRSSDEQIALQAMSELRRRQALWFNGQMLQVSSAKQTGDKTRVNSIAQRCQAVFSDPSDRRYSEVRKW